ncbi:helix-turn-helix transcriptional regulator [Pedobacter antarcticus]|uniref:LexA family transcriptional regulator n=1 Tax=Pedobacter antarcticus TaxID=34086 RepID=UPI002931DDBE|nr:helix-turn-helix domain-containing protein [Pedobacter antarcticus]
MTDNQIEKISQRFKELRKSLNKDQKAFAKEAGILQSQVSEIENNKRNITAAIIIALEDAYGLNRKWLESGDGEMIINKNYSNARFIGEIHEENDENTKFIEISPGRYRMSVPLVEYQAKAGYLMEYADHNFIEDLPKHEITVNKYHKGRYIAFEVDGESMDDGSINSIPDGCIITCREIKRELWYSRLHTHKYPNWVFVHKTMGVVVKQIVSQNLETGVLILHSLNPNKDEYPDYEIHLDDVLQILNVVKREL